MVWGMKVCALTLVACVGTVHAQDVLYGVQGGELHRIDAASLQSTTIGTVGFNQIGGLAFCADGTLYGIDAFTGALVSIDVQTGAGTEIGGLGVPVSQNGGLACDPTSDVLYAVSTQGAGIASFLVTVSQATGAATPVADTGANALVGLAFDGQGQLWGLDGAPGAEELVRIDKLTGATKPVMPGGVAPFPSTGALDVGPSGTFWTVNRLGTAYELVAIDPASGIASSTGLIAGLSGATAMNGLASENAGYQLFPPSPGVAPGLTTMLLTGATPGELSALVVGLSTSDVPLGFCPGQSIGVFAPILLQVRKSSSDGVVGFRFRVRPSAAGIPLYFQAIEPSGCQVSNLVEHTF